MLSLSTFFLFLLLGGAGGLLAGLLGVGGGIIFVPLLVWVFPQIGFAREVSVHAAFGTSLAIIIPTAVSSALAHRQRGNVEWKQVYRLSIGAAGGAVAGGYLASSLSGGWLQGLFGLMQVLVGLRLFLQPRHLPPECRNGPPAWQLIATGFATGGFSAFFGVGGGVIAVPLMVMALQLPTQLAVGNSSALIAVSSVFGVVSYIHHGWQAPGLAPFSLGYVNALVAAVIGPSAMLCARWGVSIASRLTDDKLLKIFAILLIVVGFRMLASRFF